MEGKRVQQSESGKSSNSSSSKKRLPIILGTTAGILAAGYLGLCGWVGASDQILPNVSVAQIEVGGMTHSEAENALVQAWSEIKPFQRILSYGSWTDQLDSSQLKLDCTQTVQGAWEVGRENFFSQGWQFLAHQLGLNQESPLVLSWTEEGMTHLEELFDQADLEVGGALLNGTYAVEADELRLTKGVSGVAVDREEAAALALAGMTEGGTYALGNKTPPQEIIQLPGHDSAPVDPDFDQIYQSVHTQPKDATVDPETYQVTDHVVGVDFDVAEAERMYQKAAEGETITIPLTLTQPEETKESLESKLFRDVLGQASSVVTGDSNRKTNVELSVKACDNIILMPGEIFAYNEATGSRTIDRGYKEGTSYINGQTVPDVGGGVCQTSSTIYYAVLHTTLEIVERHNHAFAVGYVPDGMDATVYYGALDFRFQNSSNYPIKLSVTYDRYNTGKVTATIYGTNENGYYAVPQRTRWNFVEPTITYTPDESIPQGTTKVDTRQVAYTGRTANTIRYIYDQNGNLVEKQDMGNSTYKMRPKIVLYNPADGDPATWVNGVPPTPESQPASGTESSSAPENSTSEPSGTQNNNTTNSAVDSGNNGQDAGAQLPQPEPAPEPVLPISPTPPSGTTGT